MIAWIPARGGSVRLPRKALADLGGKPVLAWTIEAAQAARRFSAVVVSSDDAEIRDVATAYGAEAHVRPPSLATDTITLAEVLGALAPVGPLAILLPTSPFRTPETIRRAVETFQRQTCAQLLSITPYVHPPQWALLRHGQTVVPAYPALFVAPRQRLTPAWQHDGSYWIVGGPGSEILAFETPLDEVCDINTPQDLDYARWMLSQRPLAAAI